MSDRPGGGGGDMFVGHLEKLNVVMYDPSSRLVLETSNYEIFIRRPNLSSEPLLRTQHFRIGSGRELTAGSF
jgi:hypothetical protein